MSRKFVVNLALLLLLNLLIKPFWVLGMEPIVQQLNGNKDYGEYSALFQFSFLLNILLDFGLTNFNNKNIAQNNHLLTKHFSGLFTLKLMMAVAYIILTLTVGFFIGYDFRYMKLLIILGFNQFLISMIQYLRSNLLGLHHFKADSIVSVLDRSIMIVCSLLILSGWFFGVKLDILTFVYIQTTAYLLTAIISFVLVINRVDHFKLKFNRAFSVMILKQSFPFAILVLLMTFYNRLDFVMIERLLPEAVKGKELAGTGAYETGVYTKAFRLLDAGNMIAYLFAMQLLPTFSRMIMYKEDVQNLLKLSVTLLIAPAMIVAVGCCFYQEEIMNLINNKSLDTRLSTIGDNSPFVFGILMWCFIATSTTYIFGTLLTANGSLKQLNTMACIGILINLGMNVFLIPRYHAVGAAISSLTTQMFTALIQVFMAKKIFNFQYNKRLIFSLSMFLVGIVIINMLSKTIFSTWLSNFILMGVGCVIWAFVTQVVSLKSILRFAKYN